MTKLGKNNQKRLAKLVSMALMCAGGGLFSLPSVASASEVTVTNVTGTDPNYNVISNPAGGMQPWMGVVKYQWYPTSASVLNITGEFTADTICFYGGHSAGASGKTVNITGTNIVVDKIAGGYVISGHPVTGNHVNFLGGTTTVKYIYGGFVLNPDDTSDVSDNHVKIAAGSTVKYAAPGYGTVIGGGVGNGDVDNNTVTISGTLTPTGDNDPAQLTLSGGMTTGNGKNATGNSMTISDATLNMGATDVVRIYGGESTGTDGNATGNTVTISGNSTFGDGTAYIYGGVSLYGAANDNTVEISGGTIKGTIYGGSSVSGAANDNTVEISGGTIKGTAYIIGGIGIDSASNNTVTIKGDASVSENTYICGGQAADTSVMPPVLSGTAANNTVNILKPITVVGLVGGIGDETKSIGNTLNIAAKNVTVGSYGVAGFQNMNFYLPSDIANGDTMLTVNAKDAYGNGAATDLTGVAIGAAVQAGATLAKGDAVNLITNPAGLTTDSTTTMKQITDETVTIQTKPTVKTLTTDQSYKLEVAKKDETTIMATITDVEEKKNEERTDPVNAPTKSLVETRAATTTFVNAGADMLSTQGFSQAANAVALEMADSAKTGATGVQTSGGFTPFAAFGGSSLRAESGSHVDTKGFGLNVGFARELPNSQGKLLFGPVVEYGGGNYDSYLDDGTKGEGGAHYFGVGLMARQVNHDGFYYEGSLRGGRVNSDYKSRDVVAGQNLSYDSDSNYWAAHLGVGKAMNVGGSNTLDAYLRYFYSHQAGDDATVKLDGVDIDRASFDAVDSNRIRIGARLTHKVNERNSFYGGLAYQYEFSGEARAHFIDGTTAPSPSVKGSSGLLELGWQVKPGEGPLTLDLGVTGWAGKQRGGSVQLGATWTF